jgi:hypothetical protein
MTDLLDPPIAEAVPPVDPDGRTTPAGAETAVRPAHWFLAALLVGAGAIHLAMAPSHLGESAVEGAGFIVAAWVQIAVAVLVVTHPRRWVLGAAVGANVAFVAAWAVSRTAGLPFGAHSGHRETVSLVDGACVALEVLAVMTAGFLLAKPTARLARSGGMAFAGALGAFVLTTAAIASPSARDHAAGSHGEHGVADAGHGHDEMATAPDAGGAGGGGHDHGAGGGEVGAGDDLGWSQLQNGQMGDHHDHADGEEAVPVDEEIDADTAAELAGLLALTAPLVEQYPTLGAAEDAGWWQSGPFAPGLGVHYSSPDYGSMNTDGVMDPVDVENPMLIFDGITRDAKLAGFMYMAYQDVEPEGFPGPLDTWHYHTTVCIVNTPDGIRTPFGADLSGVTEEMCAAEGGQLLEFTGYMVHVWTVPGYESELGTFSDLNPKITCPDGTYYSVPIAEVGTAPTTCRNP